MLQGRPRPARRSACLAVGLLTLGALACGGRVPPSEHSLILVTLDTTRADRIGTYGGVAVPTPALDAVARDGVVFENAVSQVPLTLPAHASMLTGRYPASHGVRHNGIYRLGQEEVSLAERLREEGWETAAFVAAFVMNRGFGLEQGFDTYDDIAVNRYAGGQDQVFMAQRIADEVNARVFEWLERPHAKRFFLWVHYYDPHHPYEAPEKAGRTLAGSGYDREISYMDACFGDLVSRLRKKGLLDRSLLVVAGDHGESLGEHGEKTHGIFLYEGVTHVPMILRAPSLLPGGTRVPKPVELVDIAPTVLALLGLRPLERAEGRSLVPRIRGTDNGDGAVGYAESLMTRLEYGWSELRMVHDGRFKYIEAPRAELYDLLEDPREERNLLALQPERGAEMASLLGEWVRATTPSAAPGEATRSLSPEEEARLRSLGYLGGDYFKQGEAGQGKGIDPKDAILDAQTLEQGRVKLREGDAAGGLELAESVLRTNPMNHLARETQIIALTELKRFPEAEDRALAALAAARLDPGAAPQISNRFGLLLARIYKAAGRLAESEREYRRVLQVDPSDGTVSVDLALLLLEQGRRAEARSLVEGVLKKDAGHGLALAVLFRMQDDDGEADAALVSADALSRARSGDPPTLVRAGKLLAAAGKPSQAADCYEAAQEMKADLDPDLVGMIGVQRLAARQLDKAESSFRALTQLLPLDPRGFHYLGVVALERGDEKAARANFGEALRRNPRFSASLVALGKWLGAKGRKEEALDVLGEALRRNPGDLGAQQSIEKLDGAGRP